MGEKRTLEQLKNHYLVEKSLADQLKAANREDRKKIYETMYDELFEKVPDHPRLVVRENPKATQRRNRIKFSLLEKYLRPDLVFLEFAPGDCQFSLAVADKVKKVYAVDISDQSGLEEFKNNFELIVYNGYDLALDADCIDLVFSDQLIEHFHPEDTVLHFQLAKRVLKKGAKYIFRTPHAYTGPYDISKYFSDVPEGFHLKEWTFTELEALLKDLGYQNLKGLWKVRSRYLELPIGFFVLFEKITAGFSKSTLRWMGRYLDFLVNISIVAQC